MPTEARERISASAGAASLRLDKWLWFARFFKSRSQASKFCADGRVRVSGSVVRKAHHPVRDGDVLTFVLGKRVRVVRVIALGTRRGPAPEARALYEDLSPVPEPKGKGPRVAARERGAGRPTKADRRAIAKLTGRT